MHMLPSSESAQLTHFVREQHLCRRGATWTRRRSCSVERTVRASREILVFRQMLAVIGGGEGASVRLHAGCGFTHAGRMNAVGWKKGRWLDTVYMQKPLGPGAAEPPLISTIF